MHIHMINFNKGTTIWIHLCAISVRLEVSGPLVAIDFPQHFCQFNIKLTNSISFIFLIYSYILCLFVYLFVCQCICVGPCAWCPILALTLHALISSPSPRPTPGQLSVFVRQTDSFYSHGGPRWWPELVLLPSHSDTRGRGWEGKMRPEITFNN